MEPLLLITAILIAGLACPTMMWWQRRRGREGDCCAPTGYERSEVEALRERQQELAVRIAELDDGDRATAPGAKT